MASLGGVYGRYVACWQANNKLCTLHLQDGVKAANGGTQQAIQLVVHRIYEKLVAALAEKQEGVDTGGGLTLSPQNDMF